MFVSNFTPLVVILNTLDNALVPQFEYKMWNFVTPLENIEEGSGSFSHLQELVKELSQEYECEDHVYFYGCKERAYEALLHSIESGAHTLYLDNPKISLIQEDDLDKFLSFKNLVKESFPLVYLSESFNEKNSLYKLFKKHDLEANLKFFTQKEIDPITRIKNTLDMLEKVTQ